MTKRVQSRVHAIKYIKTFASGFFSIKKENENKKKKKTLGATTHAGELHDRFWLWSKDLKVLQQEQQSLVLSFL